MIQTSLQSGLFIPVSLLLCSFSMAVLSPPCPRRLSLSISSNTRVISFQRAFQRSSSSRSFSYVRELSSRSIRRYSSSLSLSEAGRKAALEPNRGKKRAFSNEGVMGKGSLGFSISLLVADRSALHLSLSLSVPHPPPPRRDPPPLLRVPWLLPFRAALPWVQGRSPFSGDPGTVLRDPRKQRLCFYIDLAVYFSRLNPRCLT